MCAAVRHGGHFAPLGCHQLRASPKGAHGRAQGLSDPFQAARYHSLVIDRDGFPEEQLEVTARTEDGTIMAVRHRTFTKLQVPCHTFILNFPLIGIPL